MYLSKLKIFGFKSFANKVEINLEKNGLTAVVGPNGCGKSNIIDAIRWVLGEQKIKKLRSNKMEDVIFSGSSNRPPMNMAEVSLVINNDQGILDPNISQIMITRKIFRTGETAYLINNQPCRLKDIQTLFYDTGVGVASYSLIESSMIDEVLNDKGDERRSLFEEAAGIGKYKKQRSETKRQLAKVFVNLNRVEDHIRFMQKNVNSFERQAEKATKWKSLHSELKQIEISYFKETFNDNYQKQQEFEKSIHRIDTEIKILETQKSELEILLQDKKLNQVEQESIFQNQNQKVVKLQSDSSSIANKMDRSKDRIQYLKQSIKRKDQEKQQSEHKIFSSEKEKKEVSQFLEQDHSTVEVVKIELLQCEEAYTACNQNYQLQREKTNSLLEQRVNIFNLFSETENKVKTSQLEIELLKSYDQESQKELDSLQIITVEEMKSLENDFQRKEKKRDNLKEYLRKSKENIFNTENQEKESFVFFQKITHEKESLQVRLNTYQTMQDRQEGMSKSYQYLTAQYKKLIRGSLSSFLKVPSAYTFMIEQVMGEFLQTLILEKESEVQQFFKDLSENKKGTSFLFSQIPSRYSRFRPSFNHPAIQGWLIDKMEFPPFLKPLMEYILGHYLQVDALSDAILQEVKENANQDLTLDLWLVTSRGECLHTSGLNKGGDVSFHGPLDRQNIILKLTQERNVLEKQEKEAKEKLNRVKNKKDEMILSDNSVEKELILLEEGVRDSQFRFELSKKENDQSLQKIEELTEKGKAKQEKLKSLESSFPIDMQRLAIYRKDKEKVESQFQLLQFELERLEKQKFSFESQKNKLSQQRNQLENKIQKDSQKIDFLNRSQKDYQSTQMKLELDGQEWEQDVVANRTKIDQWALEVNTLNDSIRKEVLLQNEIKKEYDTKVLELDHLQSKIQKNQKNQKEENQEKHNLELKYQQVKTIVQGLCEKAYETYEIDMKDPEWNFEIVAYDKQTVQQDISHLKEEMKKQGGFTITALEDYEEEKNCLADVQEHYNDLQEAKKKLEKTITRLDEVARKQFMETFEQIQNNFQEVFSTLFEGGKSRLVLLEEEGIDFLDAKIEINVSPSGKKMRGVTLLSGGERALTSISLLFSLYLIRTSPYCIMDEVDGPLDDANIGRFINLLRRFSHRTQFIVVTHNKKTMASADLLYGVTQEIKGISQLSSVRLDESLSLVP